MNEIMKCARHSSLRRRYGILILALSPWLEVARMRRSGASKMSKIAQVGPSGTIAFQDRKRSIGNDVLVKNIPIKNVFARETRSRFLQKRIKKKNKMKSDI